MFGRADKLLCLGPCSLFDVVLVPVYLQSGGKALLFGNDFALLWLKTARGGLLAWPIVFGLEEDFKPELDVSSKLCDRFALQSAFSLFLISCSLM